MFVCAPHVLKLTHVFDDVDNDDDADGVDGDDVSVD